MQAPPGSLPTPLLPKWDSGRILGPGPRRLCDLGKHLPDWSNQQEMGKLGAEAFAYVNVARFAAPLRIGLALGLTPWIQKSILDPFQKKDETHDENESS